MQNKANSQRAEGTLSAAWKKGYGKKRQSYLWKNKANFAWAWFSFAQAGATRWVASSSPDAQPGRAAALRPGAGLLGDGLVRMR